MDSKNILKKSLKSNTAALWPKISSCPFVLIRGYFLFDLREICGICV